MSSMHLDKLATATPAELFTALVRADAKADHVRKLINIIGEALEERTRDTEFPINNCGVFMRHLEIEEKFGPEKKWTLAVRVARAPDERWSYAYCFTIHNHGHGGLPSIFHDIEPTRDSAVRAALDSLAVYTEEAPKGSTEKAAQTAAKNALARLRARVERTSLFDTDADNPFTIVTHPNYEPA